MDSGDGEVRLVRRKGKKRLAPPPPPPPAAERGERDRLDELRRDYRDVLKVKGLPPLVSLALCGAVSPMNLLVHLLV